MQTDLLTLVVLGFGSFLMGYFFRAAVEHSRGCQFLKDLVESVHEAGHIARMSLVGKEDYLSWQPVVKELQDKLIDCPGEGVQAEYVVLAMSMAVIGVCKEYLNLVRNENRKRRTWLGGPFARG